MINNKYLGFLTSLLVIFSTVIVSADDKKALPLWEIGLGVGALNQSYYTGTKQRRTFAFPVIIPTYRGKIFKSDDKGIRAQLFKSERVKLDLSADFNLAVDSDEIDLRKGMDDIENVLQVGPSFEFLLKENKDNRWFLNFPIRGVFEVGGEGVDYSGFNFSPNLFYQRDLNILNNKWKFGATVGPQFGSSDYHDIFYGVDDRFATADRNSYQTDSGYSGSRLQLTMNTKNRKRFILWFLRYENISGASFDDSPLVETKDNLTVGFLYTHNFLQSKTLVNR